MAVGVYHNGEVVLVKDTAMTAGIQPEVKRCLPCMHSSQPTGIPHRPTITLSGVARRTSRLQQGFADQHPAQTDRNLVRVGQARIAVAAGYMVTLCRPVQLF